MRVMLNGSNNVAGCEVCVTHLPLLRDQDWVAEIPAPTHCSLQENLTCSLPIDCKRGVGFLLVSRSQGQEILTVTFCHSKQTRDLADFDSMETIKSAIMRIYWDINISYISVLLTYRRCPFWVLKIAKLWTNIPIYLNLVHIMATKISKQWLSSSAYSPILELNVTTK